MVPPPASITKVREDETDAVLRNCSVPLLAAVVEVALEPSVTLVAWLPPSTVSSVTCRVAPPLM